MTKDTFCSFCGKFLQNKKVFSCFSRITGRRLFEVWDECPEYEIGKPISRHDTQRNKIIRE